MDHFLNVRLSTSSVYFEYITHAFDSNRWELKPKFRLDQFLETWWICDYCLSLVK
jgi:hypothetical protein